MIRKFCIGDIRGDLFLLKELIQKIGPTENDTTIFLGSYLGPGGNSKGVLDYLLQIRQKPGKWIFLKGCYEFMFLQCIGERPNRATLRMWQSMGGMDVFESYASQEKLYVMTPSNGRPGHPEAIEIPLTIPEFHIRFLEQELHGLFEDDLLPFVACHNGYYAGVAGKPIREELSVFTPNGWWDDRRLVIPGKEIIYSHVPTRVPLFTKGKIGIDLGAGLGGKLCAMEMYERKFTTVGG
jgi:serine/threonine protein phosphatase 1